MPLTNNDSKISWTWRKEDHFVSSTPIPNMVHMYVNSICGPPMIHPWSTYVPSTSFFNLFLPKLLPLVHIHTNQVDRLACSNIWIHMSRLQVDAKKGLIIHCIVRMLDIFNITMVVYVSMPSPLSYVLGVGRFVWTLKAQWKCQSGISKI
jgi:hypothetical protein